MGAKIIFITGTDTGVGKTLLTALLLCHLRRTGIRAMAMKPFCSGGFGDIDLLRAAQDQDLSREEICPFYFSKPLAPVAAVKNKNELPSLKNVLQKIHAVAKRCDVLLVEGSGGVMVPLGVNFFVVDVIKALKCEVILVAPNKLGTINHTLLSVRAVNAADKNKEIKVVLTHLPGKLDLSSGSNAIIVRDFLSRTPVVLLPFLGRNINKMRNLRKNCKKLKNTLARLI